MACTAAGRLAGGIFILLTILADGQLEPRDENLQRGGRLIADILEIFVPGDQSDANQQRMPPYGLNRRYSEEERLGVSSSMLNARRAGDQKQQWSSLAQEVLNMFTLSTTTTPAPTTQAPFANGIFGNLADRIPGMFKSLFNSDEEQITTSAPVVTSTLFPTFPTLAPLFPGLFAPSTTTEESVFSGLKTMFERPKPGSQIDTGKMDRFIIREQSANQEDFWSNLVGGNKWNERGIQWEDGNLKLVNKKGNKLLGAEVAVHDRSIDIPVQRWFSIAGDVLNAAYQQNHRL